MNGRAIPHAAAINRAAVTALAALGETELCAALERVHQATHDLVQAIHAEREAPTHSLQRDAREKVARALDTLSRGMPHIAAPAQE